MNTRRAPLVSPQETSLSPKNSLEYEETISLTFLFLNLAGTSLIFLIYFHLSYLYKLFLHLLDPCEIILAFSPCLPLHFALLPDWTLLNIFSLFHLNFFYRLSLPLPMTLQNIFSCSPSFPLQIVLVPSYDLANTFNFFTFLTFARLSLHLPMTLQNIFNFVHHPYLWRLSLHLPMTLQNIFSFFTFLTFARLSLPLPMTLQNIFSSLSLPDGPCIFLWPCTISSVFYFAFLYLEVALSPSWTLQYIFSLFSPSFPVYVQIARSLIGYLQLFHIIYLC